MTIPPISETANTSIRPRSAALQLQARSIKSPLSNALAHP